MSRSGHGETGLVALLDALEEDVLLASAEELRDVLGKMGRPRSSVCQEIRMVLDEALASVGEEPAEAVMPRLPEMARRLRH